MERCATCRHWEPLTAGEDRWNCHNDDQKLGACMMNDAGPPQGALVVATADGVYGGLVTDARFGCVLHQPKV